MRALNRSSYLRHLGLDICFGEYTAGASDRGNKFLASV